MINDDIEHTTYLIHSIREGVLGLRLKSVRQLLIAKNRFIRYANDDPSQKEIWESLARECENLLARNELPY